MTDSPAPAAPVDNAPAPAAPAPAPSPTPTASDAPNPIRDDGPPQADTPPKAEKPPATPGDALKAAKAKIEARDKEARAAEKPPAPEAKPAPAPKSEQPAPAPIDPNAKPAAPAPAPAQTPAQPTPAPDAPSRFTPEGKAAWNDAPEPVKAEVKRAFTELEGGIEQYRKFIEPLKPFIEATRANGTDIPAVLGKMRDLETAFMQDPVQGLNMVARELGFSVQEVAARILGQAPDAGGVQQERVVSELNQRIAGLEKQLGGVSQTLTRQAADTVTKQVTDFASSSPRFDELAESIARLIETGMAKDLPEAYQMADRLNPAPSAPAPAPVASSAAPAPSPQPAKEARSIRGAPSSGSDPDSDASDPPQTIREALRRATQKVAV